MSEIAAKKDTAKLQRAIIDGLEDVKAQEIAVFDTEHLSALFERVIVASGTSNRQTKALASSVRDAVREAGFPKPRIEGQDNGEWIIVDCGACVVHVMQPAIRTYYHLEEIWGDKPVRMKLGASKPAVSKAQAVVKPAVPAKSAKAKEPSLRRSSAAKTAIKAQEQIDKAEKLAAKRPGMAKKTATKKNVATTAVSKSPAAKKTVASKTPAKKFVPRAAGGRVSAKTPVVKTAPAKKAAGKTVVGRSAPKPRKA